MNMLMSADQIDMIVNNS